MFLSIFIFIILAKTSTRVVLSLALILGALAIVFCLALDLLKCNSLIEWNDHFDQTVHYFGRFWTVLDGKNWSKQVLSSFFPFCPEETGFGRKKPNPVYNGCDYLSMLGLKLNHVSKRGPNRHKDGKVEDHYCQTSNIRHTKFQNLMFLISSCSCLCPIHWSQVLSR